MAQIISQEEIVKIAHGSQIELLDSEIQSFIQQTQDVLSYAQRVRDVAADVQEPSTKNVNVFRADQIVGCDPEVYLKRAPEREGNFFVVPVILENS
jgi:aspartyl-tRNA(Asn)/glutamyl-tRNA(Gln) amidotransferase subunit C